MTTKCKHENFSANVKVARLEDIGKFMAEIRIACSDCGVPMEFFGLPVGLDVNGAMISPDGLEARISIFPTGEPPPEVYSNYSRGFSINSRSRENQF